MLVQIGYFTGFCKENIHSNKNVIFEIPILCFISVLLESSGRYGATSIQYNTIQ